MGILRFLLKVIAGILIFFSIFTGMFSLEVSEWDEHPVVYIILYFILGLIPYLLGYRLFAGKEKFKEKLWISLRIYTAITVFFTLTMELYNYLRYLNHKKLSHPGDIYLDSIALPDTLYFIALVSAFIAVSSLMAIYITWFKVPKIIYIVSIFSLLLGISIPWISKDDYRAIREEGIVMEIQGEYTHIPWNKVHLVDLNGYIEKGGRNPDRFKWDFIFYTETGTVKMEKIEFNSFGYTSSGIKNSLKIKKKVKEKGIPFSSDSLSEKEWRIVQKEMKEQEDEKTPPNPEDFYSLFEYNPIEKRYER